jgi:phosphoglycolate phosphatase
MMNNTRLLIFDLDGTLLDTAADVHVCINAALKHMDIPAISREQSKKAIGPGSDQFFKAVFGRTSNRIEEFRAIFLPLYEEHCLVETKPFPGVVEMLQQLYGRYDLAVATNKRRATTVKTLQGSGIMEFFEPVITPESVQRIKPAPDMIHHALDYFSCHANQALLIGDTDNDILAARAAGVPVILAEWGYGDMEELSKLQPEYTVKQPEDIVQLLYKQSVAA